MYELLQRNIALNHLEDRVTAHPLGMADYIGIASAKLDRIDEVFCVDTLDHFLGGRGHEPVSVVKVDVEGMEIAVLRGARETVSRHRPFIYAEAGTSESYEALSAYLSELEYTPTGRVFNATPTYEFVPAE
jgi:hypothetical protein